LIADGKERDPLTDPSEATETVAEAIVKPSVRKELIQNLEPWLHGQFVLLFARWQFPFEAQIGQSTITDLSCIQCTMTYTECLIKQLGVEFCKRRYESCPRTPVSALTISLPVTEPIGAVVTFEASASYREKQNPDPGDKYPYRWCVRFHAYDTTGFGVLDPVVRPWIKNSFLPANGKRCWAGWDPDYE
jgi:hypothetical protein